MVFGALESANPRTAALENQKREPLTPWTGSNRVWLLSDAGQNPAAGWQGFDLHWIV
jgi:hypothetical protein